MILGKSKTALSLMLAGVLSVGMCAPIYSAFSLLEPAVAMAAGVSTMDTYFNPQMANQIQVLQNDRQKEMSENELQFDISGNLITVSSDKSFSLNASNAEYATPVDPDPAPNSYGDTVAKTWVVDTSSLNGFCHIEGINVDNEFSAYYSIYVPANGSYKTDTKKYSVASELAGVACFIEDGKLIVQTIPDNFKMDTPIDCYGDLNYTYDVYCTLGEQDPNYVGTEYEDEVITESGVVGTINKTDPYPAYTGSYKKSWEIEMSEITNQFMAFGTYDITDSNGLPIATLTVADPSATELSLVTPAVADEGLYSVAEGASYTAIKIFDADVNGDYDGVTAPKASNLSFADGVNGSVIAPDGWTVPSETEDGEDIIIDVNNAQNAAEYIAANIKHQPGVDLDAKTYGLDLSKRLIANGAKTTPITADSAAATLSGSGYYLIVKTDALTGENTAATSPIYAALGEGENTIYLKTAIPSIAKQIEEDSTGEYGKEADHTLNQDVNYRLIGSVAANVNAYETYTYSFNDTWNADAMTLKEDSVVVKVNDFDVTDQAVIDTETAGVLNVSFADLKALTFTGEDDEVQTIAIDGDTQVVVEYTAYQSGNSASTEGIVNNAKLSYANNPIVKDSTGTTPNTSTTDYSYALRIHKTDNATGADLEGVEFTIKNTDNGKYLAIVDDKLMEVAYGENETPYAFKTDKDGLINIDGVDADTYVVNETKAKANYELITDDINVVVNASNRDGVLSSVTSTTDLVSGANADDVAALVNVKNIKEIGLPSTGEMGIGLVILIAVGLGIRAVVRKRQKDHAEVMILD